MGRRALATARRGRRARGRCSREPTGCCRRELVARAAGAEAPTGVAIGVDERAWSPVMLDLLGGDPHLLVFGDGESGKTTCCAGSRAA